MSRSVMKPWSAGTSLPESLLHRRIRVAEVQGEALAKELGVSGDELEVGDSSRLEALVARVCRLESLLHTLRLNVFRTETAKQLNTSHTAHLQEQLAALQEQCEEEQRSSQREVTRLRAQLQQEREEAQREAHTLREQLHVSYRTQTDVAVAADELKKVKVQLHRKLHQMKEDLMQETAARLEAEQSLDALLQRVKEIDEEVEREKEQVKHLQAECHALNTNGQEVRAELEEKAELIESLQEECQQLRQQLEKKAILELDLYTELKSVRSTLQKQQQENSILLRGSEELRGAKDKVQALNDQLEAQCSDLSSALRSLTEENVQLQASLKIEQERTAQHLKDMDLQLDTAKRSMHYEVQEALADRCLLNKELERLKADHTKLQQSSATALDAAVNHHQLLERTIKRLRGELSTAIKKGETMQKEKEELCAEMECVRSNVKSLQEQLKQRNTETLQSDLEDKLNVLHTLRKQSEVELQKAKQEINQLTKQVNKLQRAKRHGRKCESLESSSQQGELQAERCLIHTLQEKCQMLEECVMKLKEERDETGQKMKEVSLESHQINENMQEAHRWFRSKFDSLESGLGHSRASLQDRPSDGNGTSAAQETVCVAEPELERWAFTLQRWERKKELDRIANSYKT